MIILKSIGNIFVKLWRWIKETAWVQPLLIVGGIFAIIFSIPYIVKWVQSWSSSSDAVTSYFKKHQLSLDGAKDETSEADELMHYMLNSSDTTLQNKYGTKFFLLFTKSGCEGCENVYYGLKTLEDNWNENEFSMDNAQDFHLYTIFIDETDKDETALFQTYFYEAHYLNEFEELSSQMTLSYYYANQGGSGSSYATNIEMLAGTDSFTVPTLFYIDFAYNDSSACRQTNSLAVTEILFAVDEKTSGSGNFGRARTLFDAYNHTGEFAKKED